MEQLSQNYLIRKLTPMIGRRLSMDLVNAMYTEPQYRIRVNFQTGIIMVHNPFFIGIPITSLAQVEYFEATVHLISNHADLSLWKDSLLTHLTLFKD
jgi:hypothetical protein